MMKRLIRNLRQQPKGMRDNIALGVAVVFTSAVVFGWMYSLPMKVSSRMATIAGEDKPGFTSIFKGVKEQIAGAGGAVKESDDSTATAVNKNLIGDDYQVVMPNAAKDPKETASTSTATTTSTLESETASTTASSTPRSIRIVTTNSVSATSTTTRTH